MQVDESADARPQTEQPGPTGSLSDLEAEGAKPTNELAIASLCLGVVWIFGLGSLLAVVFGLRSLRQIRESAGVEGGRSLAIAGVVIGAVGLASAAFMFAFGIIAAGQ